MTDLMQEVEEIRKNDGMSQAEMARRLGITEAYYSLLLNRQRNPGRKFLSHVVRTYPHLERAAIRSLHEG